MNYELRIKNFFAKGEKNLSPKTYHLKPSRGFGLVEILIASAIIAVVFSSLGVTILSAFRVTDEDIEKIQAGFLAEEGVEVMRLLRGEGWAGRVASLEKGRTYYPVFTPAPSSWTLEEADPGPIDGKWNRTIVVEDVYRKTSDDDIVDFSSPDAKYLDLGTVRVSSLVSWTGRRGGQESLVETYLTDLLDN